MPNISRSYYQYIPLRPRQFRVLKLHPATDQLSSIRAEIHVIDVDGSIYFDALSYTWGPSTLEEQEDLDAQIFTRVPRCYPINVDDRIVLVTRSLRDALRVCRMGRLAYVQNYLADQGFARMEGYLFADAVCINQQDFAERAQQVKLMCDIYRSAKTVRAWLGNEQPEDAEGFEAATKLAEYGYELNHRVATKQEISKLDPRNIHSILTVKEWVAWAVLLSREWFWRTWVVQEVAVNRNTTLHCGQKFIQCVSLSESLYTVRRGSCGLSIIGLLSSNREHKLLKKYFDKIMAWLATEHPLTWIQIYRE